MMKKIYLNLNTSYANEMRKIKQLLIKLTLKMKLLQSDVFDHQYLQFNIQYSPTSQIILHYKNDHRFLKLSLKQ